VADVLNAALSASAQNFVPPENKRGQQNANGALATGASNVQIPTTRQHAVVNANRGVQPENSKWKLCGLRNARSKTAARVHDALIQMHATRTRTAKKAVSATAAANV